MTRPVAPSEVFATRSGVVESFDDHVGAGRLRDSANGDEWWFHCTRIEGAERSVDNGARVSFRLVPGPTGMEAIDVAPARTTPTS